MHRLFLELGCRVLMMRCGVWSPVVCVCVCVCVVRNVGCDLWVACTFAY